MVNILVHGLGQNETSWNKVKEELNINNTKTYTPNLFSLTKNYQVNFENMYKVFADYCNSFNEKVNLVGLSLGGILAIYYAVEYPEKINSITLIGTPYKIPKMLFKIQNVIFKFMPKKTFTEMGCSKKDFINLVKSMTNLNIPNITKYIKNRTIVICGEKDKVNMKGSLSLNNTIKNSKSRVILKAGHEVNIDEPKELSNVLMKFWNNQL